MTGNADGQASSFVSIPRRGDRASLGLGQLIKRLTSWAGLQPCGSCLERAARLDQLVAFTPSAASENVSSAGDLGHRILFSALLLVPVAMVLTRINVHGRPLRHYSSPVVPIARPRTSPG
jgi:hypothetical protein